MVTILRWMLALAFGTLVIGGPTAAVGATPAGSETGVSAYTSTVEFSSPSKFTAPDIAQIRDLVGSQPSVSPDSKTVSAASTSHDGYERLPCNSSKTFGDAYGTYSVQKACGKSTAPWGWKMTSAWQSHVVGTVSESGMAWTRNGKTQSQQSPHPNHARDYQFHGTYNPVNGNDNVKYSDHFSFRHNIGSGGTAKINIAGKWYFNG
jgi:hypothetical protein